jgi:hypothetical protein
VKKKKNETHLSTHRRAVGGTMRNTIQRIVAQNSIHRLMYVDDDDGTFVPIRQNQTTEDAEKAAKTFHFSLCLISTHIYPSINTL